MNDIYKWIDDHRDQLIAEFKEILRIPSSCAEGDDQSVCAEWVLGKVRRLGVDADLSPTQGGPPVVFGTLDEAQIDRSLVCYAHYDVQPVAPIEAWSSEPYGAHTVDGKIIARGTQDDKSGVMAFIHAARAFLETRGKAPVRLKFVFEGEEEIGSPHFGDWVETHRDALRADGQLIIDGTLVRGSERVPVLPCWPAGFMNVEFRCRTTKSDFYSAEAQWAPNAAWRLVWALASMKDENERITIDGWYDDWIDASEKDWENCRAMNFDIEPLKEKFGVDTLLLGRTDPAEIYYARHYLPTMTINGIQSGYVGEGTSTRVPCYAFAKVDFRIKAGMNPDKLLPLLRQHLDARGFSDVECIFRGASYGLDKTPDDAAIVQAIVEASQELFEAGPAVVSLWSDYVSEPGGSYAKFGPGSLKHMGTSSIAALGVPLCDTSFADGDSIAHAPDEFISEDYYIRGIKYTATIMQRFAEKFA